MPARPELEICVDGVEACIAAERGGADRLELCAGLIEGGTTPSAGTLELALERVRLPIVVLIRPRRGGFVYSAQELETMKREIAFARRSGAHGVALGVLDAHAAVDVERTRALVDYARPLNVTFHRAFDFVAQPLQALEQLIDLGVDRVLSSGGAPSAEAGVETLAALVRAARGRLQIVAAGGIRAHNARAIAARTGVGALHGSARASVKEASSAPLFALDASALPAANEIFVTQPELVRAVRQAIER